MMIKAYYYLVADSRPEGMPNNGPFATKQDVRDFAKSEYDLDDIEDYDEKSST